MQPLPAHLLAQFFRFWSGRIRLREALLLPLLLAVGLGVGGASYLSWRAGQQAVLQLAQQLGHKINDHVEKNLERDLQLPLQINSINKDAVRLGLLPDLMAPSAADLSFWEGYFARQLQHFPEVDYIGFVYAEGGFITVHRHRNGTVWAYSTGGPGPGRIQGRQLHPETGDPMGPIRQLRFVDLKQRPWFAELLQPEGIGRTQVMGEIFLEPQHLILTGLSVRSEDGLLQGSLTVAISTHKIQALLDSFDRSTSGLSFLLDGQGRVLAGHGVSPDREPRWGEEVHPLLEQVLPLLREQFGSLSAAPSEATFFRLPVEGKIHLIEVQPIRDEWGLEFYFLRGIPEATLLAGVNQGVQRAWLFGGGVGLAVLGLGVILTDRLVRPLRRLTAACAELSSSQAWPQLDPGPIEEVQTLASAWEQMVASQQALLQRLQQQQQEFRETLEQQSELICRYSPDTRLKFVNEAYLRFFGVTREQCLGKRWIDTLPEAERDLLLKELASLTPAQPICTVERVYSDSTDSTEKKRYINWVDRGIFDHQGRLVEILSVGREITEQRTMELALRESEEQFRTLIEDLNVGVLLQGRQGEILLGNPKALELLDLRKEELLGRSSFFDFDPAWDLIREDGSPFPESEDPMLQAIATGKPVRDVVIGVYRPRLQDRVWLLVNAKPRLDAQGQVWQVICTFTDITPRIQAERTLRLQAARDHMLGQMTDRIRHSLDWMEILQTTVTEVRQLLQADRVVIYRLQPNGRSFIQVESVSQAEFSLLGQGIGELQFEDFVKNFSSREQVYSIADVEEELLPSSYLDFLRSLQVRASLVVPLWQDRHPELEEGEYLWGLLAVDQCRGLRQWQDWERSTLMQLSPQLSIVLQQARLYQRLRNLNNDLEKQVELRTAELQQSLHFERVLRSISNRVVASLDEAEILYTITQEMVTALDVVSCDISFFSEDQSQLIPHYECRPHLASILGKAYQLQLGSEAIWGSFSNGEGIHCCCHDLAGGEWVTLLSCPILDGEELLGALNVERPCEAFFLESEIRLVRQVANLSALVLRQARLYKAAQAQVTELERLNVLKDDFVSTVSHELRTPITNVRMALRMLEIIATDPEKQRRYLQMAIQECERQIALINDLLDMQKLEAEGCSLHLEELNLSQSVPELLSGIRPLAESKNQQLQLHIEPGIPILRFDPTAFSRVLRELLHNAIKYTAPEATICVHLSQEGEGILCTVSNEAEIPQ
ncbi:MAG: GAF domain-containing protein, partial [Thermostichus sp. DG_1_5_bins_95]